MSIRKPQNEAESCERFVEMYERPLSAAARSISLSVLGHEWGVNGYTTLSQADALSGVLATKTASILEIGSANGWPGEYIAHSLSASIVVTDVLTAALRRAEAADRSGADGSVVHACGADARQLPFRSGFFDALIHSDVLC
jgi:SAM-dependent methyltransferase